MVEKRPALNKAAAAVKDVFRRIDWLKVAKRAGGLALTAFTGIPTPDQIGAIVGSLEAVIADPAKLATKENLSTAIDEVKAVLKPGETKNVPEEVEAFRKAFDQLLKDAGIKQLIVLIDDLDRCLPDTAIETLEAITFDTKPAGVDGLVVLVKAQPGLQGRLMDFLEALPSGKCGPWTVSGWQGVIKDAECAARLTKLLGEWSKVANNPGLKASAEAALKDVKGGR